MLATLFTEQGGFGYSYADLDGVGAGRCGGPGGGGPGVAGGDEVGARGAQGGGLVDHIAPVGVGGALVDVSGARPRGFFRDVVGLADGAELGGAVPQEAGDHQHQREDRYGGEQGDRPAVACPGHAAASVSRR